MPKPTPQHESSTPIPGMQFFGGPLDGHVQPRTCPSNELAEVLAIPVNHNIVAILNGEGSRKARPATSVALYMRHFDGGEVEYRYLRSEEPSHFQLSGWRG